MNEEIEPKPLKGKIETNEEALFPYIHPGDVAAAVKSVIHEFSYHKGINQKVVRGILKHSFPDVWELVEEK
jgi:hypothetical protein